VYTRCLVPAIILLTLVATCATGHRSIAAPAGVRYEGYGSSTAGGAHGDVYRVTSLADGGPGTLRYGIARRRNPRTIVFDVVNDHAHEAPGDPDAAVVTTTQLGHLWVSGNILSDRNQDHYSTVPAPLPVPAHAQVTTWPASELQTRVLPHVGMKDRDTEEESILDGLTRAM
jgi:hypothetical protein